MSKQQRRPAKSLRATRQKRQSRNRGQGPLNPSPMFRSPRVFMPQEYTTTLKYIVQDTVTNVGAAAASIRFRTEAYDVDPALASTAMPGFAELAGIYARYRTLSIGYKFSAGNQEAFNVTVIHGFSCSSIASGALVIGYSGNPNFYTSILGPLTGQGRGVYSRSKTVVAIAGTRQALYDDTYTGSTSSATLTTAGTVYCNFGIISPVALTAAGVLVTVEVTLRLTFYRPLLLTS